MKIRQPKKFKITYNQILQKTDDLNKRPWLFQKVVNEIEIHSFISCRLLRIAARNVHDHKNDCGVGWVQQPTPPRSITLDQISLGLLFRNANIQNSLTLCRLIIPQNVYQAFSLLE
jgi:hypothetical protein